MRSFMKNCVEFVYHSSRPAECTHEEFSAKLRDYFFRYGPCEVLHVLQCEDGEDSSFGNSAEPISGTYSFVLKFQRNTVANQIKQKYDGVYLYNVRLGTSWWPNTSSYHPNFHHHMEDTGGSKTWRKDRGAWAPQRRGSNFPQYHMPTSGGSWRESHGRSGASRRDGTFSSGSYHGSNSADSHGSDSVYSTLGENSLKSERGSPPGSPPPSSSGHSTHSHSSTSPSQRHSSPTTSHHRASSTSSHSSSSPRRSRHISMASSTSSSSESTASECGNGKASSSAVGTSIVLSPTGKQPHIASPFVAAEDKKEVKLEGRVLRSHSSLHTCSGETRTRKASSLSLTQAGPSVSAQIPSRYNTRSKKKIFDEREMVGHMHLNKKHCSGRRRVTGQVADMESGVGSNYGNQQPALSKLKSEEMRVAMEAIVDSDSSLCDRPKKAGKAAVAGESSQSEEEIWVERKVEIRTGMSLVDEVKRSRGCFTPVHWPDREETVVSICSLPHSRGVVEGPSLPAASLCVIDDYGSQVTPTSTHSQTLAQEEAVQSSSPFVLSRGGDGISSMLSGMKAEGHGSWPCRYGNDKNVKSTLTSLQGERDETPPADLLEASHHLVQGEFSEWYHENFQSDPQALQIYLDYCQEMEGKRREKSKDKADHTLQIASPSGEMVPPTCTSDVCAGFSSPSAGGMCVADDTEQTKFDRDLRKGVAANLPPYPRKIVHGLPSVESAERDGAQKSKIDCTYSQEIEAGVLCNEEPPSSKEDEESLEPSNSSPSPYGKADNSLLDLVNTILGGDTRQRPTAPRKVEEKYTHLQKHALRQFLLRSKPLILSTQTFISSCPSNEEVLLRTLTTSLEQVSEELANELWNEIDAQDAIATS